MDDCRVGFFCTGMAGKVNTRHINYTGLLASLKFGLPVFLVCVFLGLVVAVFAPGDVFSLIFLVVILSVVMIFGLVTLMGIRGSVGALCVLTGFTAALIDASFRTRELTDTSLDPQNIAKLFIWIILLVIGVFHYFLKSRANEYMPIDSKLIAVFGFWCVVTTIYSITPMYSFGAGLAFFSFVAFAFVVTDKLSQKQLLMSLVVGLAFLVFVCLAMYFLHPSKGMTMSMGGRVPRLSGILGSPNNLGRVASLLILFLYLLWHQGYVSVKKIWVWLLVIASSACLILSQSKTSLAAAILSIAMLQIIRRPGFSFYVMVFGLLLTLVLVVSGIDSNMVFSLISRSGDASEITSATGRVDIWVFIWNKIIDNPLLGYGYGSTKLLMPSEFRTMMGWTSTSAHNFFLQCWVTTGLIGLMLVIVAMVVQIFRLAKVPIDYSVAIFTYVIVNGLFEPGAIGPAPNILTFVWIVGFFVRKEA